MATSTAATLSHGHGALPKDKTVHFLSEGPLHNIVPVCSITVPHTTIGTSMKLHVPVQTDEGSDAIKASPAYIDYLKGHLEYKKKSEPWLSEVEAKETAIRELKSMQLGYPGFDEATVRCLTGYLGYICEIDNMLETLPLEEARQCAQGCIAILTGQKPKEPNIQSFLGKAEILTTAFYDMVTLLLPRAAADATLSSTRDMVASQLPERVFLKSNAPLPGIQAYLKLREHSFGLLPHLFLVEHYFMPGGAPSHRRADIDLLMKQVVYISILQNDASGLEKDIENGNPSNTILILAKLASQPIEKAEDVLERQPILRQAEALHDGLIQQIIATYLRIQRQATSDGERRFSFLLLDLCRRQLQWTLGDPEYDIRFE